MPPSYHVGWEHHRRFGPLTRVRVLLLVPFLLSAQRAAGLAVAGYPQESPHLHDQGRHRQAPPLVPWPIGGWWSRENAPPALGQRDRHEQHHRQRERHQHAGDERRGARSPGKPGR